MTFPIGSHLKQIKKFIRDAAAATATATADKVLVVTTTGISVKSAEQITQSARFSGFVDVTAGADVTGFTIPAAYLAAKYLVRVYRDATSDLFEVVELNLVNKAGTWVVATADAVGDDSAVDFAVTSNAGVGQIRYASTTIAGHVAASSYIEWKLISYI
jgi:hypothetical protein